MKTYPFFNRKGKDLYVFVVIKITEACLGATIKVQKLNGEIDVKISAVCSQNIK